MNDPTVVGLIWAQTPGGVIGVDNTIPWHIPEDLAHFRQVTTGHPVVMGRRTWDSLPARFRPLPQRRNIVVSRDAGWAAVGATAALSVDAAVADAGPGVVWVIGGGEIYRAALPFATHLEVTEVDLPITGDTYAPLIESRWSISSDSGWRTSRVDDVRYRFRSYVSSPAP